MLMGPPTAWRSTNLFEPLVQVAGQSVPCTFFNAEVALSLQRPAGLVMPGPVAVNMPPPWACDCGAVLTVSVFGSAVPLKTGGGARKSVTSFLKTALAGSDNVIVRVAEIVDTVVDPRVSESPVS